MALDLSGLTILLVEDNTRMRRLVQDICLNLGVGAVVTASDGGAGFEALRNNPVELVICDWVMEPVDGLSFARRIRTDDKTPNPRVPIIMLTSHAERRRIIAARDAGVNEFLAKPFTAAALYARIRSVIEQPRRFVQTGKYSGPDRRRSKPDGWTPKRRAGESKSSKSE